MNTCIHAASGVELFRFDAPYMGEVLVCRPCRRELALRTVERPRGLVPVDLGRIGYQCSMCGGSYTGTDAMSCKCKGRIEDCQRAAQQLAEWLKYRDLVTA